jgi:hypothetical protein
MRFFWGWSLKTQKKKTKKKKFFFEVLTQTKEMFKISHETLRQ